MIESNEVVFIGKGMVLPTYETFKQYVEKLLGIQGTSDPSDKEGDFYRHINFCSPTGVHLFYVAGIEENAWDDDLPTWWVVSCSSAHQVETLLRKEINDRVPGYYGDGRS